MVDKKVSRVADWTEDEKVVAVSTALALDVLLAKIANSPENPEPGVITQEVVSMLCITIAKACGINPNPAAGDSLPKKYTYKSAGLVIDAMQARAELLKEVTDAQAKHRGSAWKKWVN